MSTTKSLRAAAASLLAALVASLLTVPGVAFDTDAAADLIVGLVPGATTADLDAGTVVNELRDLGLLLVTGDDDTRAALEADSDVAFVADNTTASPTQDATDANRLQVSAARSIGVADLWAKGYTGAGQTVALIDTGVAEHADLTGRVVHGPDFSGEGHPGDSYGHGTVMAGVIAGDGTASNGQYMGIAPDAQILSVKAAGANGVTDISQILVSMQWVVTYREAYGVDVLVLAYSNDSRQSAKVDPLAYAIQRAVDAGIVVVASAGNDGTGSHHTVSGPGSAPAAITVGAYDLTTRDVAGFSGIGPTVDGVAKPELVAPGVDIVAPAAAGSTIVTSKAHAMQGDAYIRGSGTSQAAAIVGGIAALARQAFPAESAVAARARVIRASTKFETEGPDMGRGKGLVDITKLLRADVRNHDIELRGNGTGSLHASRGTHVVTVGGKRIEGEITVLGTAWDGATWANSSWDGSSWDGSSWDGSSWDGSSWDGSSWDGSSWDGSSWDGSSWDAHLWN